MLTGGIGIVSQNAVARDLRTREANNIVIQKENGLNKSLSENGTDVINIVNPNSNGLSHNKYNEFDKYNFDFLLNKNFMLTKNQAANYKLNIGASYSDDRLLSRNKFDIGSEYTVRGFKESSVSGDKGIYINNTLTLLNENFSPFIGLDFGISKDKDLDFVDKIAGMAAGVKYNRNNLNMSLTFSKPLKRSKGMPKESNPIYYNISYSF